MKSKGLALVLFLLLITFSLTGCKIAKHTELEMIAIAASSKPHTKILEGLEKSLEKQGYALEIIEVSNHDTANAMLQTGEIDANYIQDRETLLQYNEQNNGQFVELQATHFDPIRIFSQKYKSIEDIPDGTNFIIPKSKTHSTRALLLLQEKGLIEFSEEAGENVSVINIKNNPHMYTFQQMDLDYLGEAYKVGDVICMPSYPALSQEVPLNSAIAKEEATVDSVKKYTDILVVKKELLSSNKSQALLEAFKELDAPEVLNKNYEGWLTPIY